MALEGIEKESGKRIKLWDMSEAQILDLINRIKDDGLEVTCQYEQCGCRMHVKALGSEYVITHFARYPKTGKNVYHPTGGGEGQKHLLAKAVLARQLKALHPEAEIITEYRVDGDMPHKSSRRIDVYMELPSGETEAHEIQLSSQSYSKTVRRTADLQAYGIGEVVWWWDTDKDEYTNIEWCIENLPRHGLIKFKYDKIMGKTTPAPVDAVFYIKDNAAILDYRRQKQEEYNAEIERRRIEARLFPRRAPKMAEQDSEGWKPHDETVVARRQIAEMFEENKRAIGLYEIARANYLRQKDTLTDWEAKQLRSLEETGTLPDYYTSDEYKFYTEQINKEWNKQETQ